MTIASPSRARAPALEGNLGGSWWTAHQITAPRATSERAAWMSARRRFIRLQVQRSERRLLRYPVREGTTLDLACPEGRPLRRTVAGGTERPGPPRVNRRQPPRTRLRWSRRSSPRMRLSLKLTVAVLALAALSGALAAGAGAQTATSSAVVDAPQKRTLIREGQAGRLLLGGTWYFRL